MQAVGGAVIADIGDQRPGSEARVEPREIGALMDVAALGGGGEKGGAVGRGDMAGSSNTNLRHALGLMSGTSLDGIDVAALATDGERRGRRRTGAKRSRTRPGSATGCAACSAAPARAGNRRGRGRADPAACRRRRAVSRALPAGRDRPDRLPRPHDPAPSRRAPHLADRRRRAAGAADRDRCRRRFPQRRCRRRRAGRAAGAALPRRAGRRSGKAARGAEPRRRRQRDLDRRRTRRNSRLRHRAGQCADRRLGAASYRRRRPISTAPWRWPGGLRRRMSRGFWSIRFSRGCRRNRSTATISAMQCRRVSRSRTAPRP